MRFLMTLPSPVPAHRAEPWNSLVNFPWASLHDQIPSLCPGPALDRTRLGTRAVRGIISTRLHRTRDDSRQHPQHHPVPVILPPRNDVANGMASKRGGRLIGPGGENAFRPLAHARGRAQRHVQNAPVCPPARPTIFPVFSYSPATACCGLASRGRVDGFRTYIAHSVPTYTS